MEMTESWFSDVLERKYLTTLSFDDPSAWSDAEPLSFPGPSWKTLTLLDAENMFHARIVHRSGAAPYYQILLYRTATGDKFGDVPATGIKLKVSHNETELFESKYEQLTWFENVPNHKNTRVQNNSLTAGYQSPPNSPRLMTREHSIPRKALTGNEAFEADPKFHLSLEIRIVTNSGSDGVPQPISSHEQKIVLSFAKKLKVPYTGDVEFIFKNGGGKQEDGTPLKLYAFRDILEPTLDFSVLTSASSPPAELDTPPPSPTNPQPPLKQTFPNLDYEYELFHLVLFYLYTGRIIFSSSPDPNQSPDAEIPITDRAEGIYATSHRLKLNSLDEKAFHFLKATCTVPNITGKVFSKFAEKHERVGQMYDEFFLTNWRKVLDCREFDAFFEDLENGDFEEYVRVNKKFREMIRRCV